MKLNLPPDAPGTRNGPRPPSARSLLSWYRPIPNWAALPLAVILFIAARAQAVVTLPIEWRQDSICYNYSAVNGVPISALTNNPAGSDGRMPIGLNESGSYNVPTINQFQSLATFGGVASPTNWRSKTNSPYLRGTNAFSAAVAEAMQLPLIRNSNSIVMVARSVRVGTPYLSRAVSLSFGSLVQVPATSESGATLGVVKETYWLPEPYSTNNHLNTGYYWSPHARQVYAIQSGPVFLTWRKAQSYTVANVPGDYQNPGGASSFETNGTSIYLLYTTLYIVSGSAVKPPRTMYWTERDFRALGHPITIPSSRIGALNIVYNNGFPRTVDAEYRGPGYTSPTDGSTNSTLQELRTLWYDQSQGFLSAYNFEGRIFIEFLGDLRADGQTRIPLGFELVDVVKQPTPLDLNCDLGERLVPPLDAALEDLVPQEIQQGTVSTFNFRYFAPGSSLPELYASRATENINDCLVHWLEPGVEGVLWPKLLGRHHLIWPDNEAKYSHYLRPLVNTEAEAIATAVPLAAQNVPIIAYQDPLDLPRAKLTADFKFYTFLDATHPAHRTLLRFTAGDRIGFERVFSWLDGTLRSTNFAGSVATNLTEVANHLNYGSNALAYTNLVALQQSNYLAAVAAHNTYLAASNTYRLDYTGYTNYLADSNSWRSQYTTYTNYLATSNTWRSQYTTYTNYVATSNTWRADTNAYTYYLAASNAWRTYTNYLATSNTWRSQYTLYTNYLAADIPYQIALSDYNSYLAASNTWRADTNAYTYYLTNRARGVNGAWKLYVRDTAQGDFGSSATWNVLVVATNVTTPFTRTTNTFNGTAITIPDLANASPYPSTITVSGINNASAAVQAVRVKLNGLTHTYPGDIEALLVGPTNTQSCALLGNSGGNVAAVAVNLVFDDAAIAGVPTPLLSGTYLPTDFAPANSPPPGGTDRGTSLDALLQPLANNPGAAPTVVANPGTGPTVVANPGAAPTVVANPGGAPTVVANPGSAPTVVANPGSAPTVVANPGAAPTLVSEPIPPIWVDLPTEPVALAPPDQSLWSDVFSAPRLVEQTVNVGERIRPPTGEPGSGDAYLAGYINQSQGNLFNPGAYVNPFGSGFAAANRGAIIPVNAVPGTNLLEVWWFRPNNRQAGLNAGNGALGFSTIHWPAYIGRYTIQWPESPREIVLASKLGSGTLDPYEVQSTIYAQNQKRLPGYNPNEEHALMSGGTAFATRDDLNITSGVNYSSEPFVLLNYTAEDGRPAMAVFRVLREKPEAGYVFDYIVPAGQMIEPPPPLGFLQKPVDGSGMYATRFNVEVHHTGADYPGHWTSSDTNGIYGHYDSFTWVDRKHNAWVYRGPHAGIPSLQAGAYNAETKTFQALSSAEAIAGEDFSFTVHASRQDENLSLVLTGDAPSWLRTSGLTLLGKPDTSDLGTSLLALVVVDLYDGTRVTNNLQLTVVASGAVLTQLPMVLVSSNAYTRSVVSFTTRPPFLAAAPTPTNSFTMRYYYKTEASFDWPGITNPPAAGSIVPYLRPVDPATGEFVGRSDWKHTQSLEIVYRPVWPVRDPKDSSLPLPTLPFGATLTMPAFNLPGIRDMRTARVLYQQSVAQDITNVAVSVVLHDATREKYSALASQSLTTIPSSVKSEYYQGKYYFPNLPPHLGKRVFFDPNRGTYGSLVLKGEFVQAALGENYTLLNVLTGLDLQAAKALCPTSDTTYKAKWDALVAALATDLETFVESTTTPGTYVPDPSQTVAVGVEELAEVNSDETAVDSYALSATGPGSGYVTVIEANGWSFTQPGDPVSLHIFKIGGSLYTGELKVLTAENPLSELVTFQHTADLAGRYGDFEYQWKIAAPVDGLPPLADATMSRYLALDSGLNHPRKTLGGAGIQALTDNYVVMRYRPMSPQHPLYSAAPAATATNWSDWTEPKLAEGWIKRVLAGINPFNQRVTDFFNNAVSTDASLLTQAGRRWEGDVALNLSTINNYGLIEIYETVLRRGRMLSIEAGYNYGPANDALLLAAGYLNDLYMMLGNEAWADAANPTIGIGTKNSTYGDVATALFAFKGQVSSLLNEELALLEGRDDFLLPGARVSPVYNRLVWNYTRGIDSGEVIYALNYNIQEDPNRIADGVINAADAAVMFPQGHGDAYGHYLTALKGYYSLLMNSCFDWVPRIEAVNVLGQPVSVDYFDERKFAASAAAVARAGQQICDLTWRESFEPVHAVGWAHLASSRTNSQHTYTTVTGTDPVARYWGLDHWACRTGQGAYLNWVVGNAILPAVDGNENHEGIQKVDRIRVPELQELTTIAKSVQTSLDSAEGGLSPLGVPEGGLAFDLNPNVVVGTDNGTHFEQVYQRAKVALNNAVASFDDAKDVTQLMRSEQDSLAEMRAGIAQQELAYRNSLIGLYGTPYPEDIGAGKTWAQGYAGPDLIHFSYMNVPESDFGGNVTLDPAGTYRIDTQPLTNNWVEGVLGDWVDLTNNLFYSDMDWVNNSQSINFVWGAHGFFSKPAGWTGNRQSPGKIQQAISDLIKAHHNVTAALSDAQGAKEDLTAAIRIFNSAQETGDTIDGINHSLNVADEVLMYAQNVNEVFEKFDELTEKTITAATAAAQKALPTSFIAGTAAGGDLTSAMESALESSGFAINEQLKIAEFVRFSVLKAFESATTSARRWAEENIAALEGQQETRQSLIELGTMVGDLSGHFDTINARLREYDDTLRAYQAMRAEGDRIQEERLVYRQRAAAVVQGYRVRDVAFRLFRNEKLERYKTLFDLAARYSLLSANAYDYETGLLGTSAGRDFKKRIINARALGVVRNGEPQFAGSNTGDPGLSSALAEMKADWDVLRGRLGFNNPDAYGTTVSLRTEALRILPSSDGDSNWKDTLQNARVKNILEDADVRRFCMQVDDGSGLPVPGIVLTFSTTIANGYNLFGRELAAGDHAFSPSSFATKIFGVGTALIGYRGMDDPSLNSGTVTGSGGTSPSDPNTSYLDPLALSATPYIYLIPVGVDSMRSPPLGDASTIRSWSVEDVAIPMPFNIGNSDFSNLNLWQSSDSLTEPMYTVRKHQAFRPVSTTSVFSSSLYGSTGTLLRSQFTNNRLVGRSVWNSQWKLVIPGRTLLNNPNEGLDRLIQTVTDVKLHFVTYSYSGN